MRTDLEPLVPRRRLLTVGLLASALKSTVSTSHESTQGGAVAADTLPACRSLWAKTPDGVNVAVQLWGNPHGIPLVLIHGLNQCRLSWIRQLERELLQMCQIVTYDLRGHGDSDKPAEAHYYAEGARWGDELATVLETTGVHRPVLVGWSLGGVVLTHYLIRHGREQLAAVNFVDAWTADDPALYTPESEALAANLATSDLLVRLRAIRAFLSACFYKPPPSELFELMLTFNSMPPVAVHRGINALTFDGAAAALRSLKVPVVVTHGARDRLFPEGMSRYTAAAVPGSRLSIYPDCGHSPFMEDSERFNQELKELVHRAAG
jgi:non-heme chloroperoxidase